MHVGIDATCWRNTRGYGRHARSLLGALVRLKHGDRYTFFFDSEEGAETMPQEAERALVVTRAPAAVAASAEGRRSAVDMWRMSRALSKAPCDLLLFPTVYSFVPVWTRARKVLMIHDVIAEKFPHLTFSRRSARWLWNAKVALGRRQADAVITVSAHARAGIIEHFGLAPDRVHVVGEASDPIFRVVTPPQVTPRLAELGLPGTGRNMVYLGGFGPHKNLPTLLNTLHAVASRAELADVRLIMVGEYTKEVFHTQFGDLQARVAELGLQDRVIYTGFLPDEDLVQLLNASTVLVLPSFLEGFGLPAIEAAACGCPVVATTASPLPQILGDSTLFVDPGDQTGWNDTIIRVLGTPELRARMRAGGLAAAARHSWEHAAGELHAILRKVVQG